MIKKIAFPILRTPIPLKHLADRVFDKRIANGDEEFINKWLNPPPFVPNGPWVIKMPNGTLAVGDDDILKTFKEPNWKYPIESTLWKYPESYGDS